MKIVREKADICRVIVDALLEIEVLSSGFVVNTKDGNRYFVPSLDNLASYYIVRLMTAMDSERSNLGGVNGDQMAIYFDLTLLPVNHYLESRPFVVFFREEGDGEGEDEGDDDGICEGLRPIISKWIGIEALTNGYVVSDSHVGGRFWLPTLEKIAEIKVQESMRELDGRYKRLGSASYDHGEVGNILELRFIFSLQDDDEEEEIAL